MFSPPAWSQLAQHTPQLYPKSLAFALLVAAHSYRRNSLQLSGAIAASLVGYLALATPDPVYAVALFSFYIAGTLASKYKYSLKASLVDEGHHPAPSSSSVDKLFKHPVVGRDWKQVLCNAWLGTSCAIFYRLLHSSSISLFVSPSSLNDLSLQSLSNSLRFTALAYWSGCAGDTLASELGILSHSRPRLVTTFKNVPPGTNGGISLAGTVFSVLGGLIVGTSAVLLCDSVRSKMETVIWCGIFSWSCSMIDSFLGATLQQTLFSKKQNRVVAGKNTAVGGEREIVIVTGIDLLTNNQVNLISSTLTGLTAGFLAYHSLVPFSV